MKVYNWAYIIYRYIGRIVTHMKKEIILFKVPQPGCGGMLTTKELRWFNPLNTYLCSEKVTGLINFILNNL